MLRLNAIIDGEESGFEIKRDRTSIGRSSRNTIYLDDKLVSAFHAEIRRTEANGYEVVDLDSKNGTWVNDRRIRRSIIKPGDKVVFGRFETLLSNGIGVTGDSQLKEKKKRVTARETLPASGTKRSREDTGGAGRKKSKKASTDESEKNIRQLKSELAEFWLSPRSTGSAGPWSSRTRR